MRATIALCALVAGCAAQQRGLAYEGARVARELADSGADAWKDGVAAQAERCRAEVPKESSTRKERASCMGIFNETDQALAVFEKIVAAQLAVYWALKFGEIDDVRGAAAQLDEALRDARPFLDAARKAIQ